MSLKLHIPDSVLQAIRLPGRRLEENLLAELAVALYAQEALSLGKARELAGMSKYEFGQLLSRRGATVIHKPKQYRTASSILFKIAPETRPAGLLGNLIGSRERS